MNFQGVSLKTLSWLGFQKIGMRLNCEKKSKKGWRDINRLLTTFAKITWIQKNTLTLKRF